ncbi:hypothetical protein [Pseudalkalibacillus hwajinpoensis]|uniref:Uncharacterized protein n=1 Tax=Guptibacillus hwajinpoensis TaxID=208199 RepID=A0A4U1MLE5_9BACL|nr:hypothetical protein [Pseudalkalibacillus hwajinpoensis]TKD72309.1 hypothetical protein FBF83_05845 [Pseudalkalibacillus hwajinpoensis]
MSKEYILKLSKATLALQGLWLLMFLTNILGMIGSYNETLQDLIWLLIPTSALLIGVISLSKQVTTTIALLNIVSSVFILLSWVVISGIDKM